MADDFGDLKMFHSEHFLQILSGFYMNWSGRVLRLFLLLFSTCNDLTFYVSGALNGLAFLITVFLISIIALGRIPLLFSSDRLIFLLAFSTAWFGMPALGECVFWRDGAVTYLLPMLSGLAFITPFVLWYKSPKTLFPDKILYGILMIPAGIIAGVSHEQVIISAGFLLGLWVLYILFFNKGAKKVPVYLYIGLVSFLAGGVISLFAPGNFKRMNLLTFHASLIEKLAKQAGDFIIYVIGYGAQNLWVWLVVILLTAFIINSRFTRDRMNDFILWLVTAFVSILLVILFPLGGQRPMYYFIIFVTIAFTGLLGAKPENTAFGNGKFKDIITALILGILITDCTIGLFSNYYLSGKLSERQEIIKAAEGKGKITVPAIDFRESHITFTSDNPNAMFLESNIIVDYSYETAYRPKNVLDELKVYLKNKTAK